MPASAATSVMEPRDHAPLAGKTQLNDLLWEVTTYVELMGEAALADIPLTLPSCGMLQAVLGEPGITVSEISRRIPKTQQAISQVVARLEKHGLLERRLGSGRGVGLFVTEAGRRRVEEGIVRERQLQVRLRELLGDERYEELSRLLGESRAILREAR
jgi:DNA-binding MarR family transcriptional regulator